MVIQYDMDLTEKLRILGDAAKFDVSCSSSGVDRKNNGKGIGNSKACGICHSFAADGRCISLLKILFTNECIFNCRYCINRSDNDTVRTSFTPEEVCTLTMQFYRRNYIEGLFLSSGITHNPNYTMSQLVETVYLLREKYHFGGYIHLKAIPGAAADLIEAAGMYADRMSVNLELPTADGLALLAPHKSRKTILTPMRQIQNGIYKSRELPLIDNKTASLPGSTTDNTPDNSDSNFYNNRISTADRFHAPGIISGSSTRNLSTVRPVNNSFVPAGQSTQMIVGATAETDKDILYLSSALYKGPTMRRVYYSGYISVNTYDKRLPALKQPPLVRENRLYQADWLMRFYQFKVEEIVDDAYPDLDLEVDPKLSWALRHPEQFPIDVNKADYEMLLRVPGIGVKSARLIVASRRFSKIGFYQLKKIGVVMKKAQYFITCCELPMRTVNELTPQGVRSLLLPKPNKKKVDERQLMLDFGE